MTWERLKGLGESRVNFCACLPEWSVFWNLWFHSYHVQCSRFKNDLLKWVLREPCLSPFSQQHRGFLLPPSRSTHPCTSSFSLKTHSPLLQLTWFFHDSVQMSCLWWGLPQSSQAKILVLPQEFLSIFLLYILSHRTVIYCVSPPYLSNPWGLQARTSYICFQEWGGHEKLLWVSWGLLLPL